MRSWYGHPLCSVWCCDLEKGHVHCRMGSLTYCGIEIHFGLRLQGKDVDFFVSLIVLLNRNQAQSHACTKC